MEYSSIIFLCLSCWLREFRGHAQPLWQDPLQRIHQLHGVTGFPYFPWGAWVSYVYWSCIGFRLHLVGFTCAPSWSHNYDLLNLFYYPLCTMYMTDLAVCCTGVCLASCQTTFCPLLALCMVSCSTNAMVWLPTLHCTQELRNITRIYSR